MKKLLTFCLMLLGAVAQAQNFAITATTEAAVRKNIVKGNAANYGFGVINDTLKLIGLTTRNVIFTGSINKSGIGLSNVDNTSDANKPVSTATQTALNLKANIASPTFTGTLTAPTIANSLGATFATSSGGVGIGTTNPLYKLHLYNTAFTGTTPLTNIIAAFASNANGASSTINFTDAVANNAYIGMQAGNLHFGANTITPQTTLLSNGNVGIGTIAPSSKLTVAGTLGTSSISLTETGVRNYVIRSGGYATNVFDIADLTSGASRFVINSNGNVGINNGGDAGYKLDVNGTLRTYNDAYFATLTGNVGIGLTAPVNKLHIKGLGQATETTYNPANADDSAIYLEDAGSSPYNGGAIKFGTAFGVHAAIKGGVRNGSGPQGTINFLVRIGSATTLTNAMMVNFDGNIGINTINPTSKLQVVGLPVYDTNAAAVSGGLTTGAFYRTSVGVVMCVL